MNPSPATEDVHSVTATPKHLLANALLGRPLTDWVAERRAAGRSWRLVVRDLAEATGGQVDVTEFSLRTWCKDAA